MQNNILILGKGFIGERIYQELNCRISNKIIYNFQDVKSLIEEYRPKTIINCIGFTGVNNVDGCENELDMTLSANTYIPILLAEACLREKIKFVHISSGCIFHYDYKRQRPIKEKLVPDYYDLFYSRSKIYSEIVLKELALRYNVLITRIRIPLDNRPSPKNILDKLIKYKTVIDVPNSITYIPEYISALKHLLKVDARGIFNITCKQPLRYPQLLDIYKKYRPEFTYTKIPLKQLKLTRTNLILSTKKLEATGFKLKPIKEILEECVKEYIKY